MGRGGQHGRGHAHGSGLHPPQGADSSSEAANLGASKVAGKGSGTSFPPSGRGSKEQRVHQHSGKVSDTSSGHFSSRTGGHSQAAGERGLPHGESPAALHRSHAPTHVSCFVVTCSDTRALVDDVSGRAVREALESAGHVVTGHQVVPDEPAAIRAVLQQAMEAGARAVVLTGGTGITRRDQTVEAVRPLLDKEIPGFGELFRMLSFQEIGSAAWLSRALAGTFRDALVFVLPGSPNAVRLALDRLVLPELGHAVRELSR
jgi:molybdopterin adenylyltransferase